MKPRVIDAFPFAGTPTELLLLECRLTELFDVVDHFVIVEAELDHQGHKKPLNFLDNQERYAAWSDKLTYVIADRLPTVEESDWEWAREHAQREHIGYGLASIDAQPEDIIMQSDVDEIPRAFVVRNLRPQRREVIACHMRGHFWAIDWDYMEGWNGTVATRVGTLDRMVRNSCGPFASMRDSRNAAPRIPNAGWHFSWLGGREAWEAKHGMYCHTWSGKTYDHYYRDGYHQNGHRMAPVDVDETWPKWMLEPGNVPPSWYRPR